MRRNLALLFEVLTVNKLKSMNERRKPLLNDVKMNWRPCMKRFTKEELSDMMKNFTKKNWEKFRKKLMMKWPSVFSKNGKEKE